MACDETRPEELAAELGISGKTLRAWLRERFPRGASERGTNWYLTHAQVSIARTRFGPTLGRVRAHSSPPSRPPKTELSRGGRGHEARSAAAETASKSVEEIVRALQGRPASLDQSQLPREQGGLPREPGLYAWWATPGSIGGLPPNPHPDPELGLILFYVGISPNGPGSTATIRSRVIGNHLSGNIGSSTFRFTLAALLLEELGLHPVRTATKVVLPMKDNHQLSRWQGEHLRLTWCVTPHPWLLEDEVIAVMEPPLNLAANARHPYYSTVKQARAMLRRAANRLGPEVA